MTVKWWSEGMLYIYMYIGVHIIMCMGLCAQFTYNTSITPPNLITQVYCLEHTCVHITNNGIDHMLLHCICSKECQLSTKL